jgi:hypothetical protein
VGSQREEQGKDGERRARLVSKPGSHRYRTGGEREGRAGKRWGTACVASFQTGLPPVQDRWGAKGKSREKMGERHAWLVPKPGSHRYRTGGEREGRAGKRWGTACVASFQTGLPPVQDRWGAKGKSREKMGERRARLVSKPGSHRYRTGGEPKGRAGKRWGTACAASFQTGLPPVQDRWGARGKSREKMGNGVRG